MGPHIGQAIPQPALVAFRPLAGFPDIKLRLKNGLGDLLHPRKRHGTVESQGH